MPGNDLDKGGDSAASWAIEIRYGNIRHPPNPFSPAKQSKLGHNEIPN